MHLLLTRPDTGPEPDLMQAALVAAGHRITQAPLLSIALTGAMPPLDGVQALIATSRNGLRAVAAGPLGDDVLGLPLFAVGPATAKLGRSLGFRRVVEGPGGARALEAVIAADADPAAGVLLHLAGDTLAFDLGGALAGRGLSVRTEIVYRTETAGAIPAEAVAAMRQGTLDGVVLMSPRTAKVYAKLVGAAALVAEARRMVHFCLSEAVGEELGPLGAVRIAVARSPHSEEMLALIAREASDSR
ncbi:uroporphyrinogen-III synthase [Hyphomicrobium sp.]|uniref:uroporphyrinogen-III synthase n=1 Tax=Hyphomicrobium sp. TaxID=82 RepID=UPI0025BDA03A|nr:uroporphyrinogen-III synthase [Hyphomicrobium sp.]MCC7252747.1 uroporphyrinogen-III synthase [Hyphomicrobium sp.]